MAMIRIQQPVAFDLVGTPIQVAGESLTFEASISYRVGEGHDEVNGFFTAGGGVAFRQFQTQIPIPETAAFKLPRLFLQLFEISARDGGEINVVTLPILYGPLILPGYRDTRSIPSSQATRCPSWRRTTTATRPPGRPSNRPISLWSPTPTSSFQARSCVSR
ncbi:Gmad2 immunoglobulin-like domain-containing protein [Thiocystis violacea]|uniref:Gmad2 immunoglobulin-like domain-containing protein n=1 Tax=Thiocystis violacea TaxID=13725 RepID=UPI0019083C09|nr:Gmad2 immunoglobulin-like domain-containing protein [Thiocystis violacea]